MHRSKGKPASKHGQLAFNLDAAVDQLLHELAPEHEHLLRVQFRIGSPPHGRKAPAASRDALRASLRALRYQAMNAVRRGCRQSQPRPTALDPQPIDAHQLYQMGKDIFPAPERRTSRA